MPNYEDGSRHQKPRPLPGSASHDQKLRSQQGQIEQSSGSAAPSSGWVENRSGQEPLFLTMPAGTSNEAQYQISRGSEIPGVPHRSSNTAIASQTDSGELQPVDFMLIGLCLFLIVACIFILITRVLPSLSMGIAHFNSSNFWRVFFFMIIYLLCALGGMLRGRYVSKTAAGQENIQLKQTIVNLESSLVRRSNEVARLEVDKATLTGQIKSLQSSASASAVKMASGSLAPDPVRVIAPPPSIYDNPREPDDPSDLPFHPHEKVFPARGERNRLRNGWHIVAASRRGYGHAYEGKYREDDFNIRIFNANGSTQNHYPDIALLAIADGVSSKSLSRRGARAAVLGAVEVPEKRITEMRTFLGHDKWYQQCQETAYYLMMEGLVTARKRVEEAAQQSNASIEELQSTLLAFLVAPWDEQRLFVASTQVGDGGLLALQPQNGRMPRERWQWLQAPQIGGTGNEVQPFMRTDSNVWRSFYRTELVENVACIIGMTDGTADDIEPPLPTASNPHPDPFLMVDDFYSRIIYPAFSEAQPGEALLKLLGYQKKQSHDDRTIVCVYRR